MTALRTPKLGPQSMVSPGSKYYAGFSPGFVEDLIKLLGLPAGTVLLDPWNGAGTTTTVAARRGMVGLGFDINPVLVVIGKSKMVGSDVVERLDDLTSHVLLRARREMWQTMQGDDEPLGQWFASGTAAYLRSIERSIQAVILEAESEIDVSDGSGLADLTPIAASFYVVLFETVRSFLGAYTSSNPTWFKIKPGTENVSVAKDRIDSRFRTIERRHHARLGQLDVVEPEPGGRAVIRLGNSTALDMGDDAADACITSPPYCTRIDYAVLTRPELAVLGISDDKRMRELRDSSVGTPTVVSKQPKSKETWGQYVNTLLETVRTHPSYASASYYHKYFAQYFDSMFQSLSELRRVLKPPAPCALVVQDSYYKEVRIDLAAALIEMGAALGWDHAQRIDFAVPNRRANMNPAAYQYRLKVAATESLVILKP